MTSMTWSDLAMALEDAMSGISHAERVALRVSEVIVHLPDGSVAGLEHAGRDGTCEGPYIFRLHVQDES